MHTGPELAVCQIIAGRSKLGLPGARSLDFAAPELYILEPGTLHDWHDIVEDTVNVGLPDHGDDLVMRR